VTRRRVVADVVDRDRCAVRGQLERGGLPDSRVGAGDERAPILQQLSIFRV
jgi:hypothetical protein